MELPRGNKEVLHIPNDDIVNLLVAQIFGANKRGGIHAFYAPTEINEVPILVMTFAAPTEERCLPLLLNTIYELDEHVQTLESDSLAFNFSVGMRLILPALVPLARKEVHEKTIEQQLSEKFMYSKQIADKLQVPYKDPHEYFCHPVSFPHNDDPDRLDAVISACASPHFNFFAVTYSTSLSDSHLSRDELGHIAQFLRPADPSRLILLAKLSSQIFAHSIT